MEQEPTTAIVEGFPGGIVFLYEDPDRPTYTYVGGEGLEEVGLTADQLQGSVVAADRPDPIRNKIWREYRRALDGENVEFEVEAEGRHFRFQLRPVTDESGTVVAGLGIAQDITEQVVYREELERTNERLERLTSLVFHDIRNPLNVAKGRVGQLRDEIDNDRLDSLESALHRIEELTDQDAIHETDRGIGESHRLVDVARAAWANVATQDGELNVVATGDIVAEENDLRRMFENLFRNAVEHNDRSVTVTVEDIPNGFAVSDDGEGIPPSAQETIFDRGVTSLDTNSGLGLFIVSQVAERHGWTISLTDGQDGGARFEVTGVDRP